MGIFTECPRCEQLETKIEQLRKLINVIYNDDRTPSWILQAIEMQEVKFMIQALDSPPKT